MSLAAIQQDQRILQKQIKRPEEEERSSWLLERFAEDPRCVQSHRPVAVPRVAVAAQVLSPDAVGGGAKSKRGVTFAAAA